MYGFCIRSERPVNNRSFRLDYGPSFSCICVTGVAARSNSAPQYHELRASPRTTELLFGKVCVPKPELGSPSAARAPAGRPLPAPVELEHSGMPSLRPCRTSSGSTAIHSTRPFVVYSVGICCASRASVIVPVAEAGWSRRHFLFGTPVSARGCNNLDAEAGRVVESRTRVS